MADTVGTAGPVEATGRPLGVVSPLVGGAVEGGAAVPGVAVAGIAAGSDAGVDGAVGTGESSGVRRGSPSHHARNRFSLKLNRTLESRLKNVNSRLAWGGR
jgi:hypothetical protein